MNLLLFEAGELGPDGRVVLADARAEHVRSVLRAVPGQELAAGILDAGLGTARVLEVHGDRVVLDAKGLERAPVPERPRVDLLLALPRPKVLSRLVAGLACMGVASVRLCNAARVERYYFDSHRLAEGELRRQLVSGLCQAKDTLLPRVSIHRSFRRLVEDELEPEPRRVVADPGAPSASAALAGLGPVDRVLLAVGPEGGWVDFERALLAERGFRAIGLGSRVLRSDLACIAALGVVHEALRSADAGASVSATRDHA